MGFPLRVTGNAAEVGYGGLRNACAEKVRDIPISLSHEYPDHSDILK